MKYNNFKWDDKNNSKIVKQMTKSFVEKYKNKWYCIIEYSDDCQSLLEHGEIFENMDHFVVSHH